MAVSVLQLTAENAARQERRAHRALSLVSAGSLAAVLALLGVASYHLWFAWHGGDQQSWKDFWDTNKNLWWAVPLWLGWPRLREQFGVVFGMAQALRCAFADRNTGIGEPAPEQPAPLSSPELPIGTVRFGPLTFAAYRDLHAQGVILTVLGCVGAMLAVGSVALFLVGSEGSGNDPTTIPAAIVLGVLAFLCFVLLAFLYWLVRH